MINFILKVQDLNTARTVHIQRFTERDSTSVLLPGEAPSGYHITVEREEPLRPEMTGWSQSGPTYCGCPCGNCSSCLGE